ncbi:monocopper oxidase-like protein SKU5 [Striga asiatica]|uniref:Monocopper oxidase-like protein SKU5 n=1 Tax=Striga asiatica TaxID=4170 RepID=A0A5A7PQ50_STRAF|nr:monocopper oxidase-like protein SKU5 [Striga asiatica]
MGRLWVLLHCLSVALLLGVCLGADPFAFFDFDVSYITVSPLGQPQQVIAINKKFPGPVINVTTNYNVVVNVKNNLDEDLLITWSGIQMRKTAWQDGVLGTNCPIPPNWNWTYQFQVKDQIGSFYYFPSLNMQRASGGFGSIIVNNRSVIPLPFDLPADDIILMIGDWYTGGHTALRTTLDHGQALNPPDGILINGKGPYNYNNTAQDENAYETINVERGKTYRFRVHNVGVSTSLNFRIQNHSMLLVETEGYYTLQQNYTNMDIHVGQSFSFLVTMDQNSSSAFYIVASSRFTNQSLNGVAILRYSNSSTLPVGPLPDGPNDEYDKSFSMGQAKSIKLNGSASGARPNAQGSFHYGEINVTDTYILQSVGPTLIEGKLRAAYNGISFAKPETPFRLADWYKVKGAYKLDFPVMPLNRTTPVLDRSIINATYKGFIEIVLQNNDTVLQTFHLDGYSFFVVGMDYGVWTENNRGTYDKWSAISRSTVQVLYIFVCCHLPPNIMCDNF